MRGLLGGVRLRGDGGSGLLPAAKGLEIEFDQLLRPDAEFDRAVTGEEEALALLEKDKDWPDHEAALTRFKNRLVLYKAGQPYTEP